MGKGAAKKKIKEANAFIIKGSYGTHYPFKVVVEFERSDEGKFVHPSMRDLHHPKLIAPTFNQDRCHFTPTFTLAGDTLDHEHYIKKHQSKVQQYTPIEEEDIMVPRPKDKNYCHVCEDRFQDYLTHIHSEGHAGALAQDKFQRRIVKLGKKIARQERRIKQQESHHSEVDDSMFQLSSKQNHQNTSNHSQIAT